MARNIPITAGSGVNVGADEQTVGGVSVKLQEVKLAAGKNGEYIGDVGGALVDGDTNRSALYVRERKDVRQFTPTVTVNTAAYTAAHCLGGLITVSSAVSTAGNVFRLNRALFISKVATSGLYLYVFDDNPSGTTFTDHAAFPTIADADLPKLRLIYSLGESNFSPLWQCVADRTDLDILPDLNCVGTSFYIALKVVGTPDFVAASDFFVALSGERL